MFKRNLPGLSKQTTVFANPNRPAIIRLDDIVDGAVVGLHLIDVGNLLATARFLANRILHVIWKISKFNLVGIFQIQIALPFETLIVVVVVITVAVAIGVIKVAIAIAIVRVIQQLRVGVVRDHFAVAVDANEVAVVRFAHIGRIAAAGHLPDALGLLIVRLVDHGALHVARQLVEIHTLAAF